MITEDVTLRECLACHSMDVVIDRLSAQPLASVRCSACGLRTRWDSREIVIALWNTRVPDPALAVKDKRIATLGMELQDVRDRLDAVRKSLLQRDKALDVQRERIAALEAEVAHLQEERRTWKQATIDSIRQTLPREEPW